MRDRRVLFAAAALYAVLFAALLHVHTQHAPLVLYATATVGFAGLVLLARRVDLPPRQLSFVIIGVAAVLQAVALTAGPTSSDDVYRYAWDARVQFAGVDPYAHPPSSPALASLRDHALFPGGSCPHPFAGGCTLINRPTVHTIYPPAAQLGFDAARLLSGGGHGGVLPFQVLAALGVLAVTVLLLRWRRGQAVWPVALWAWSPLVVIEYGNNGHIDWLAVLLSLGALLATRAGRPARAGVLLALAVLTKIYPVLLLPSLLRRRPGLVLAAAFGTTVLLYLPHVLAVGSGVVGFLPGYLHQEGYNSGARLLLLGAVLPHPFDTVAGALILAGVAWWVYRHADPAAPERGAVVLVGVAFLVTTPAYGWYAGLLLALCVAADRYEWVPVALAPAFVYLERAEVSQSTTRSALIYLAAAAGTLALNRVRHRSVRVSREPVSV